MTENQADPIYIDLAADIVASYVANNTIATAELPDLIHQVHTALHQTANNANEPEEVPLVPAVPIKKSVLPDHIICLEDGKQFKSLKRHLRTHYNLTPDEYRQKWGLDADYPMVAPNYAAARSELAKSMGLGQQRKKTTKKK
ncbi:putative transcriptional regulator [Labrenzia sp. EL_195]|nr:putative transcriptional regulator [Labrenzia sp. EL_195]